MRLVKSSISYDEFESTWLITMLWSGLKSGVVNLLSQSITPDLVEDIPGQVDLLVDEAYTWYGITPP